MIITINFYLYDYIIIYLIIIYLFGIIKIKGDNIRYKRRINMKKLIVLLLVLSIILSGCVSNTKTDNNKTNNDKNDKGDTDTVEKANIGIMAKRLDANNNGIDNGTDSGINNDINNDVGKLSASTGSNTGESGEISMGSEWCKTGSKIIIPEVKTQEQFTVKGITTRDGVEVCEAEIIRENGKSTVYFSKDNKYISMISTSSSTGSSSKATAISEISVGQ